MTAPVKLSYKARYDILRSMVIRMYQADDRKKERAIYREILFFLGVDPDSPEHDK